MEKEGQCWLIVHFGSVLSPSEFQDYSSLSLVSGQGASIEAQEVLSATRIRVFLHGSYCLELVSGVDRLSSIPCYFSTATTYETWIPQIAFILLG